MVVLQKPSDEPEQIEPEKEKSKYTFRRRSQPERLVLDLPVENIV